MGDEAFDHSPNPDETAVMLLGYFEAMHDSSLSREWLRLSGNRTGIAVMRPARGKSWSIWQQKEIRGHMLCCST